MNAASAHICYGHKDEDRDGDDRMASGAPKTGREMWKDVAATTNMVFFTAFTMLLLLATITIVVFSRHTS